MGSPKALLSWRGKTFVEQVAEVFLQVGGVTVVTNAELAGPVGALLPQVAVCVNPDSSPGLFSSVLAGLAVLPPATRHVFVHPVDCPLSTAEVPRRMLKALDPLEGTTAASVLVPVSGGRRGHPVLLSERAIGDLSSRPASAVFSEELERFNPVEVSVEVDEILRNINTPGDLADLVDGSGHQRRDGR
jgi:CTP:molybdopterin cytidylyltransferase MocA